MNSPATKSALQIDGQRLLRRIDELGHIGRLEGGGVCRLALTDEDKAGRDQVVTWMIDLGMKVAIDQIGNIIGTRAGRRDLAPVMTGSHIDTVRAGGYYDGNLGVLAGLEVVATLNDAGVELDRPLQVAVFTNEEGARFAPDMMGSLVFQGDLPLQSALDTVAIDGAVLGEELKRIGYAGQEPCGVARPHSYMELHIEQGPVLEYKDIDIGAVTGVQGICWLEFEVTGVSNHAGTTPMAMRRDAMAVVADITCFVRELTRRYGGAQIGTVGHCRLHPNLINVIPNKAVFTVDLRNTDKEALDAAEREVIAYAVDAARKEGVSLAHRSLARFDPVDFDPALIDLVENTARAHGRSVMRMPSGAGHDAQIIARLCPAAMIFVPSVKGISHNPAEYTKEEHLISGANILLDTLMHLANS
ncbi:Zn-dependent hydrolase [Parapusillimonas sp. SGNA-6]|nr:Zn-dependent hydrolase [Parapusillimonas sp. SGNA-6]